MRRTLQAIFDSALASAAALLLATALAPSVYAQAARATTRAPRTATPSSTTTPSGRTRTRDARTDGTNSLEGQTNSREGQTNSGAGETGSRAEESGAQPDISITARVTADSLRFEKVPDPKVEFTGRPSRDTVWKSDRENLPQRVQPGVTYRDIGITLRITSVFADIDRIVAEALGEVPASDDALTQAAPTLQPDARSDARLPAASAPQESRPAPTSSPAKATTRANARVKHERSGRGR
jgi:hypothetical protein